MKKKNPKTILMKQADKLWYLKLKKPKCEVCGEKAIQVHHYYYKGSYGHLRYDLDNGVSLCQGCHFVLHAQDPKKIEQQIIAKRGQKWADNLKAKSKEIHKSYQTIGYYREVIKELQ